MSIIDDWKKVANDLQYMSCEEKPFKAKHSFFHKGTGQLASALMLRLDENGVANTDSYEYVEDLARDYALYERCATPKEKMSVDDVLSALEDVKELIIDECGNDFVAVDQLNDIYEWVENNKKEQKEEE